MSNLLSTPAHFKDSSLGLIPSHWEVASLVDCAFVTKLAGFEYTNYFDYSQPGEIIAIRVLNIRNGRLNLTDIQSIPRQVSDQLPRSALRKGDLVISYVGTIGEVALIKEDNRFHLAPNVAKISPNLEMISPHFLLAQLLSQATQKRLLALSTLTSQPALSMTRLRQLKIVLPPPNEQRLITEILNTVDETIAHTSSLIAKLKQIKAGLLHDLLTRGLDENGELRDAIANPEQFKDSPLGKIPKDWNLTKIGQLGSWRGGATPSKLIASNWYEGNILWISPKDFQKAEITDSEDKITEKALINSSLILFVPGDVIVVFRSSILRHKFPVAVVKAPFTVNQDIKVLQPNLGVCHRYVFFALQHIGSHILRSAVKAGTTVESVDLKTFCNLPFILPPETEQENIIQIIDSHDTRIHAEEIYLNKLKLQKQGLMHDLLTGKVRVNEIKQ